ncbi:MAG: hypothetical protein AAF436_05330 [Myxococcota bacterium]
MKRVVAIVGLVACLAGVWGLRGQAMNQYLETQRYEDIYYLPPPAWLQVMSLGHRRALADMIWLRALVYFGDEFANRGAVRHVFNYGDAMLTLDPDFERVYRWIGVAGVYTPEGSPVEFLERAVQVLRDGTDRFPDNGKLAWDAGATIAYELLPRLPKGHPSREALQLEANEHMMAAARLGEGPEWLVLNNATLLNKLGQSEREQRHLEEMYTVVRDPDVKLQIERRLSRLRDEAYADAFKNANREFEERRQADFPYMPSGLYFFVADPIESGGGLDPS